MVWVFIVGKKKRDTSKKFCYNDARYWLCSGSRKGLQSECVRTEFVNTIAVESYRNLKWVGFSFFAGDTQRKIPAAGRRVFFGWIAPCESNAPAITEER